MNDMDEPQTELPQEKTIHFSVDVAAGLVKLAEAGVRALAQQLPVSQIRMSAAIVEEATEALTKQTES